MFSFRMPQLVKGKQPSAAPTAPTAKAAARKEQDTRPLSTAPKTEHFPGQQYPVDTLGVGIQQMMGALIEGQTATVVTGNQVAVGGGPPVAGGGAAINPAIVKSIVSPSFEGMASAVETQGVVPFSKYPRARARAPQA